MRYAELGGVRENLMKLRSQWRTASQRWKVWMVVVVGMLRAGTSVYWCCYCLPLLLWNTPISYSSTPLEKLVKFASDTIVHCSPVAGGKRGGCWRVILKPGWLPNATHLALFVPSALSFFFFLFFFFFFLVFNLSTHSFLKAPALEFSSFSYLEVTDGHAILKGACL